MEYREKILEKYKNYAKKLNNFFIASKVCINCFIVQKNGIGCCFKDYYSTTGHLLEFEYELLKNEIDNVARTEKNNACSYSSENGCMLNELKNPFCISFSCSELSKHLKKEYGIDYDENKVMYFLESILKDSITVKETEEFEQMIGSWMKKVDFGKN